VAAVTVAVSVAAAVVAMLTPPLDRAADARKAVRPFRKLEAALSVHVSYDDYSRMLRDCQDAYDSYDPGEVDRAVIMADYLRIALEYYRAADEAWLAQRRSEFTGALATEEYWHAKYGDREPGSSWDNLRSQPSADDVKRFAWRYARACVREAARRLRQTSQLHA
jgi:hypothetical protein